MSVAYRSVAAFLSNAVVTRGRKLFQNYFKIISEAYWSSRIFSSLFDVAEIIFDNNFRTPAVAEIILSQFWAWLHV